MARANSESYVSGTRSALAGLLIIICFAVLVSVVDSAEVIFADIVEPGDTVTAWVNPQLQQQASTPSNSPAASPDEASTPSDSPAASPDEAPSGNSSTGACPEDYSNNFWNMFDSHSDAQHVTIGADGDSAQMTLDQLSAAGFGSKYEYFTGRFSAFLKLPCGNSSGTVFAFYTSSNGSMPDHDEIDIEILGNETDTTYTMQTNIFVDGVGNREMRHELLWFNPCQDYHEYFIQWNSNITMIGVDDNVLRVFYNNPAWPYFNKGQALWVTYWDGSSWATQGGSIKIDFALNGPFVADINGFHKLQGCQVPSERDVSSCKGVLHCWDIQQSLTPLQQQQLTQMNANYCTYDYCQDSKRFASTGFPADCQHNNSTGGS